MPITQSAKKALRQNIHRRERNAKKKTELKSIIKEYRKLVAAKNLGEAREQLKTVYKKLDKSAKTNLMDKNKAARLKSRLAKLLK